MAKNSQDAILGVESYGPKKPLLDGIMITHEKWKFWSFQPVVKHWHTVVQ